MVENLLQRLVDEIFATKRSSLAWAEHAGEVSMGFYVFLIKRAPEFYLNSKRLICVYPRGYARSAWFASPCFETWCCKKYLYLKLGGHVAKFVVHIQTKSLI